MDIITSGASPMLMPTDDPVGKILFIVVAIAFGLACFTALVTLIAAVLSKITMRTQRAVEFMPLRALLVGVVAYAVLAGIAAWLYFQSVTERLLETEVNPGMFAAASLITAIPLLASLLGAPGTFAFIGDRLAAFNGHKMSGLRRLALATVVAVLAGMLPVIGWFIVTPILLVMTSGAFLVGLALTKGHA